MIALSTLNHRCKLRHIVRVKLRNKSAVSPFLTRRLLSQLIDVYLGVLFLQIIRHFIEVVNLMRKEQCIGPVSWSTAVKFLCARKFDVARAVALYEQHEATRYREGLTSFDPSVDPLKTELETEKFTILVRYFGY